MLRAGDRYATNALILKHYFADLNTESCEQVLDVDKVIIDRSDKLMRLLGHLITLLPRQTLPAGASYTPRLDPAEPQSRRLHRRAL